MAFPPTFSNTWDTTVPADTQLANLLGQDLRNLRVDIMQRLSLLSGTFANRPTPETVNAVWGGAGFGLLYFSTNTGQIFQWNGAAWVDITASLSLGKYKFENSNIIPVTVANTVANTVLQTINIPATDIGAAQAFYFDGVGVIGIQGGGGQNLSVTVTLDSIILLSLGLVLFAANNQPWFVRGFFAGLTTGGAGTVTGANMIWASTQSGGGLQATAGVGPVVIDTTVSHLLGIKVQWNNASPSNTITQNFMNLYRVG
jgi:hypothetical protein